MCSRVYVLFKKVSNTEKHAAHLIGQISNLTLESLHLSPQVLFFLVHSFPVTPFFSEVLFKDFHLKHKTARSLLKGVHRIPGVHAS